MIDYKLLEILACPLCKAKLIYNKSDQELICEKCKLAYPIEDDIPVMLIDKARRIDSNE